MSSSAAILAPCEFLGQRPDCSRRGCLWVHRAVANELRFVLRSQSKGVHMRRLIPLILAFLMLGAVFAIPPVQQPLPQQQTQTKEQTVYITKTGKKYHTSTCSYLSKSKIPISLKDAKAKGFTPCSVCKPPQGNPAHGLEIEVASDDRRPDRIHVVC